MCRNCWAAHGQPADWNPQIAHALHLIRTIYATESTGGPLHVVLDDWNIDDGPLQLHRYDECDPQAMAAAEELVALLRRMAVAERASALAYHCGYAPVPQDRA